MPGEICVELDDDCDKSFRNMEPGGSGERIRWSAVATLYCPRPPSVMPCVPGCMLESRLGVRNGGLARTDAMASDVVVGAQCVSEVS